MCSLNAQACFFLTEWGQTWFNVKTSFGNWESHREALYMEISVSSPLFYFVLAQNQVHACIASWFHAFRSKPLRKPYTGSLSGLKSIHFGARACVCVYVVFVSDAIIILIPVHRPTHMHALRGVVLKLQYAPALDIQYMDVSRCACARTVLVWCLKVADVDEMFMNAIFCKQCLSMLCVCRWNVYSTMKVD